jgi:prepilin-type N-terminal cleavage/methylation domain-containing protein
MDTKRNIQHRASSHVGAASRAALCPPRLGGPTRAAFTLIELLVVITIIGILVALLTVAAVAALRTARQTEIKAEINQMDEALVEYKNKTTAFPPNAQTDDADATSPTETAATPLSESQILSDLKRHLKQAFPRHQEPDDLIRVLCGLRPQNTMNFPAQGLPGGMSAGEALVFWLGGFSSDPRYPISGEGGPSYPIQARGATNNPSLDPIESRPWVFPFDVSRLAPRDDNTGYFDPDGRFIEYTVRIKNVNQHRRINFWQYVPRNSTQPYLYFDTSRHDATTAFDPPAATDAATDAAGNSVALHVHAVKKARDAAVTGALPIQYVEPEKFQILHCGLDDAWDEEAFERMSAHGASADPMDLNSYLLFPDGPFVGEVADTIVNFTTETKLEDATP